MKILALGDSYCPGSVLRRGLARLSENHEVTFGEVANEPQWVPETSSERYVKEYFGNPRQVTGLLTDQDVLVVHGAPVTEGVLQASPNLKLVCCMRGGPVNVDVAAATARGILVTTTPGKNADAVAELTLAFMIMLARRIPPAMRYVDGGGEFGKDNFEGVNWLGYELAGRTAGLIGCGRVGSRVGQLARTMRMRVLAYDPYVGDDLIRGIGATPAPIEDLLQQSDFVSLHVRASPETRHMIGRRAFGAMKQGSFFINTSRDILVDEDALYHALASGHLAGAAFDVLSPSNAGQRHRILDFPNVVVVAHIGGATVETLEKGCQMAVSEIERFSRQDPLAYVVNATVAHTTGLGP